jgi:hypothetical protein
MFREPTRRAKWKLSTKRKEPKNYYLVTSQDELERGKFNGSEMPGPYHAFVKMMLPRAQRQYGGPDAMRAVAKMWQQHKQQRGRGLTLTGTGLTPTSGQCGMGVGSTMANVARGVGFALGLAGAATAATGVGVIATSFLEAGAAAAGTIAGAAKGADYLESLFA